MRFFGEVCSTSGTGLWSNTRRPVRLVKMTVCRSDYEFGEAVVYFTKASWDTRKYGLIYTDPKWLREFKKVLERMGFSRKVISGVDYSEQGMQGRDYVSLDVDEKFLNEWKNRGLKFSADYANDY